MAYSPFDKDIHEKLTKDDLQRLIEREVSEGYYIEYKRELPRANNKIAHSISSFANTYGGWYIVGILTNESHTALEVCGFNLSVCADPVGKVREVIKSHINPSPVFYPQLVYLSSSDVVLVVYVPGEQETPFVTKDGRIYRRINDSSDPVPENDRYAIDRLVDKGKSVSRRLEKFCTDERIFSKSEENNSWLKIFITPYPAGLIDKNLLMMTNLDLERFIEESRKPVEIFALTEGVNGPITGNLPFTTGQVTYQSVILRQLSDPDRLAFSSLTAELFNDGCAKFFVPLPYAEKALPQNRNLIKSAQVKNTLRKLSTQPNGNLAYLRFIDVGKLCLITACLFGYYLDWLDDHHVDLRIVIQLDNVWRVVPFIDADEWAQHAEKFGIPVVDRNKINIPRYFDNGLPFTISTNQSIWLKICQLINSALGLPSETYARTLGHIIHDAIENSSPKSKHD